jgi:hypothetical protein
MATGRAARGSGAYSTGDAAYLLGLSPGYVHRLAGRGAIPGAYRVPPSREWRISRIDLLVCVANSAGAAELKAYFDAREAEMDAGLKRRRASA